MFRAGEYVVRLDGAILRVALREEAAALDEFCTARLWRSNSGGKDSHAKVALKSKIMLRTIANLEMKIHRKHAQQQGFVRVRARSISGWLEGPAAPARPWSWSSPARAYEGTRRPTTWYRDPLPMEGRKNCFLECPSWFVEYLKVV